MNILEKKNEVKINKTKIVWMNLARGIDDAEKFFYCDEFDIRVFAAT